MQTVALEKENLSRNTPELSAVQGFVIETN